MKQCVKCGNVQNNEANFCRVCGGETFSRMQNGQGNICKSCGNELKQGAQFCTECGASMSANQTPDVGGTQNVKNASRKSYGRIILCAAAGVLLIAGIATGVILYNNYEWDDEPDETVAETEKEEPAEESENEKQTAEADETEEPSEEIHANVLDGMEDSQRREVNLFLSNFSEALYPGSNRNDAEQKIDFAYRHNMINNSGYEPFINGNNVGISVELLDKTLIRFFGKTVPHETPEGAISWFYEDGAFWYPAADGDSIAYFTIATDMRKNDDSTYTVSFNVYFGGEPHEPIDTAWYSLSDKEAASRFDFQYSGTTVLKEKLHNGENTYEVVSYEVNE